ncbi:MAG TPA: hypothetical protein VNN79_18115, partial [Actinomycetota bacterium]|nr:hypothetical protein [Actinomycetota bacterium]
MVMERDGSRSVFLNHLGIRIVATGSSDYEASGAPPPDPAGSLRPLRRRLPPSAAAAATADSGFGSSAGSVVSASVASAATGVTFASDASSAT